MITIPRKWIHRSASLLVAALMLSCAGGCSRAKGPAPTVFRWWMGRPAPGFDPDGPPDATRAAIERLLTRSLVDEDTLGRPILDAARSVSISPDRMRYTFRLQPGLRFTNGRACTSDHFRAALTTGLARADHSTKLWLLRTIRGMDAVRARRALPLLGIAAPDDSTLVLELSRPDSLLMRKLASPGASAVWAARDSASDWSAAIGLGPYRVLRSDGSRLTLVRPSPPGPDTLAIRFAIGATRARTALRAGSVDLMWPMPPGLGDQGLPPGYRTVARDPLPRRWLALVMRADVPPTTRLAARRALAHGIPRNELVRAAGVGSHDVREWLPGGGVPNLPSLDQAELERWLDRGKLGKSFHALMAYDEDGPAAEIARALQGDWSRAGLYLDLRPLRQPALSRELLSGQAQTCLVEFQGLTSDPAGVAAPLIMPFRGPAIGAFRTGWRTREFDKLLAGTRGQPVDLAYLESRLEEETVVLPLCEIGWVWLAREGGPPVGFHPRFGPSGAAESRGDRVSR